MGRGGTVLGIIGIILAAGAIGFTFIVWNSQNTTQNLTRTIVVGIWETLSDNLDFVPYNSQNNWLLEFGDNKLNNTDYISVSNTNTRITLLKSGWYQIHLSVLLAGISPSSTYRVRILKDGVTESFFDFYQTAVTIDSNYHSIDSSTFVYSNGTNYIEINGDSADDFSVPANDLYNQLTIRFVAI
ncbi:MAG: hypothetical protein ACFE9Q_14380 [Candidatus Hodarchaeota archaeon]